MNPDVGEPPEMEFDPGRSYGDRKLLNGVGLMTSFVDETGSRVDGGAGLLEYQLNAPELLGSGQ